jgi:hypothetical protein
MNGYFRISIAAFILLILSYLTEKNNTDFLNAYPNVREYMFIYTFRYFHYFIYLFSSFYLLFFLGIGKDFDRTVYLIVMLSIVIGWYIFDSCWLSFSELLFYNLNTDAIKTTYHPAMFSVFHTYSDVVSYIFGICNFITVPIVLYFSKSFPLIFKAIYYALFLALFFDAMTKGRVRTLYYDSVNNKVLYYCSQFYRNYLYSPP